MKNKIVKMRNKCRKTALLFLLNIIIRWQYKKSNGMELSHVCHSEVFYGAVSHGCAIVVMTDWFSQHNQNHCCHCNWFYCCYLIHFGSFFIYFILFYFILQQVLSHLSVYFSDFSFLPQLSGRSCSTWTGWMASLAILRQSSGSTLSLARRYQVKRAS